jgi:hypothetical protein
MGDNKPKTSSETAADPNQTAQPVTSPGLGSLLQGKRPEAGNIFAAPKSGDAASENAAGSGNLIPPWYFFAADVLLIVAALIVFAKTSGVFTWKEGVFYAIDLGLAAVLGAIGIRQAIRAGK